MRKTVVSFLLVITFLNCFGVFTFASDDVKYMIPPCFDDANPFSDGLAAVKLEDKWGFIDKNGDIVIDFKYENVKDFSEGLAAVQKDGKWGFIDISGKVIVPFEYDFVESYKNGIAQVDIMPGFNPKKGNVGVIYRSNLDKNGNKIEGKVISDFSSEGLVQYHENSKYGYKDLNGNIVIEAKYSDARNFSSGLAKVMQGLEWIFIDKSGNEVLRPKYGFLEDFHDGYCCVAINNNYFRSINNQWDKYGFIDINGQEVVSPQFANAKRAGEGIAPVQEYDFYGRGRWGFIYLNKETTGSSEAYNKWDKFSKRELSKFAVQPQYTQVDSFRKGIARVGIGENSVGSPLKWTHINKEGNESEDYQSVQADIEDDISSTWHTFIDDNGLMGYADKDDNVVIKPQFAGAGKFSEGLAAVTMKYFGERGRSAAMWGYIDAAGNMVIQPQKYYYASEFKEGMAAVFWFGKHGFIRKDDFIPDSWAVEEVREASELDLVPDYLQHHYVNNITREEFCDLIIKLIESKSQKTILQFAKEKGLDLSKNPFSDTSERNIIAANKLGIINGIGNGLFDPEGTITRQEGAVMLSNTAKALGVSLTAKKATFSDSDNISSWAKEHVNFVSEKGIMNGNETNFEPDGTYSRQQAILTVLRLYKVLK